MCLLIFAGSFPGNLKHVQLTWEAQIINCQPTYRTYELVTQLCIVSVAYWLLSYVFFQLRILLHNRYSFAQQVQHL